MKFSQKSLMYRFPIVYLLILKVFHNKNFHSRYNYMASFIHEGDSVLEPGSGPAILYKYLPKNCRYLGFDLNKDFISYAKKRNINVTLGDVLHKKHYKKSEIVVVCDVLHHLKPEDRHKMVKLGFNAATKYLIICDPIREDALKYPFWKNFINWIGDQMEKDGINTPKHHENFTEIQLKDLVSKGFGVIPEDTEVHIKQSGVDLIAVYQKA